jgi:hypothetical protein
MDRILFNFFERSPVLKKAANAHSCLKNILLKRIRIKYFKTSKAYKKNVLRTSVLKKYFSQQALATL